MLANIYLDKFDKYIKEYAAKFRKGDRRSINPEYWRLNNKKNWLKKKLQKTSDEQIRKSYLYEIAQLSKQMLSTPHKDAMDADFRRMQYVRYADDFLISVIGSKSECETIKADITQFMREQLKLELSDEKTLITHAQDKAKFLGYEIFIRKSDAVKRNKDGVLKRDFNGAVVLTLNSAVIQKKLTEYNALEVRNIDGKDILVVKASQIYDSNEARRYSCPIQCGNQRTLQLLFTCCKRVQRMCIFRLHYEDEYVQDTWLETEHFRKESSPEVSEGQGLCHSVQRCQGKAEIQSLLQ